MRLSPLPIVLAAVALTGGVSFVAWRDSVERAERASLPGVPPIPLVSPERVAEYVGSGACAGCHAEQHRAHEETTHARTLARAGEAAFREAFREAQTLRDPARGATYRHTLDGETPVYSVESPELEEPFRMAPAYAIGSGKIGTTFLFEQAGAFAEGRTSFYNPLKKWAWTPGQHRTDRSRPAWGKPLGDRTATACFLCHSTAVATDGARLLPEQSIFNVGCERCHGPGREHLLAVQQRKAPGPIYGLKGLSAEMIMKLCDECHRAPVSLPESELARFPDLPRFAGPGLSISECYKQGGGRLSCISCHDPHGKPSDDLSTYEPVCLSCHTPGKAHAATCPVNPKDRCISCHMPELPVEFPLPKKFRTHWIKAYPGLAAP